MASRLNGSPSASLPSLSLSMIFCFYLSDQGWRGGISLSVFVVINYSSLSLSLSLSLSFSLSLSTAPLSLFSYLNEFLRLSLPRPRLSLSLSLSQSLIKALSKIIPVSCYPSVILSTSVSLELTRMWAPRIAEGCSEVGGANIIALWWHRRPLISDLESSLGRAHSGNGLDALTRKGRGVHGYHWRELPQVSFLSRLPVCRDKYMFVLSRQK